MNKFVKWGSMLAFVIAGGLLLGGNVIADGEEETLIEVDAVSQADQVQALEAQAQSLTEQVQEYLAAQAATTTQIADDADASQQETKTTEYNELSQDELDAIQAQVKVIADKTEVIKAEVMKFVMVRQITEKIAYLQGEVDKMERDETALASEIDKESEFVPEIEVGAEPAMAEAAAQPQADVDAQIASIKAQIKDLTAQYEAQKAAEEVQSSGAEEKSPTEIECENGVCTAKVNITPASEDTKADQKSKAGVWQSVSDFLKKIFTF